MKHANSQAELEASNEALKDFYSGFLWDKEPKMKEDSEDAEDSITMIESNPLDTPRPKRSAALPLGTITDRSTHSEDDTTITKRSSAAQKKVNIGAINRSRG